MTVPGKLREARIALFLDVDGTLVELATTPDSVEVPNHLCSLLLAARERENGALALISGRTLQSMDALFAPVKFAGAGQHGVERRDTGGRLTRPNIDKQLLKPARQMLRQLQQECDGVLMEDKGASLAVHYRLAPQAQTRVQQVMNELRAPLINEFGLRYGKAVIELSPLGYSKGTAIEAFMMEAPFAGRVPVFVGDDLTDEDGFMAVNGLGGYSIRVGAPQESAARFYFENVTAVLDWLQQRTRQDDAK